MTENAATRIWQDFASDFVQEVLNGVGRASGTSWTVVSVSEAVADGQAGAVWADLAFSGSLQGNCLLNLAAPDAARVLRGQSATGQGGMASGKQSEVLAAAIDAIAGELAAAGSEAYGNFALSVTPGDAERPLTTKAIEVRLFDDRSRSVGVTLSATAELVESLHRSAAEAAKSAGQSSQSESPSHTASRFSDAVNVDLVMDVELDVTLRFGQRHLTLREVLELTSGSVVELDRQVDEPVELILDGKVIARGEAVVIDGNYGLRVTEVPHPFTPRPLRT